MLGKREHIALLVLKAALAATLALTGTRAFAEPAPEGPVAVDKAVPQGDDFDAMDAAAQPDCPAETEAIDLLDSVPEDEEVAESPVPQVEEANPVESEPMDEPVDESCGADDEPVELEAQASGDVPACLTGDDFTYVDAGGFTWRCKEYLGGDSAYEAVVYGVDAPYDSGGSVKDLHIPRTVPFMERDLRVVGVISYDEAWSDEDEFYVWESGIKHFTAPGTQGQITKTNAQIETVVIPEYVRFIGAGTFSNYTALGVVYFDGESQLKTIGMNAFYNCQSLEDFSSASSVDGVVIPSGVTEIGEDAFCNCKSIKHFTFPSTYSDGWSVYALGENDSLLTIENAPECVYVSAAVQKVTFCAGPEECKGVIGDKTGLKEVVIPEGVTGIYGYYDYSSGAFEDCTSLTTVRLPEGLTHVGGGTFKGCAALSSINLPETITDIDDEAFAGCKSLVGAVYCPCDCLVGQFANTGITSITLRSDMVRADGIDFTGCTNLQSINVVGEGGCYFSIDGVLYGTLYTADDWGTRLVKYPAAKQGSAYTPPDWVKTIDELAFEDCRNLTEIHVPVTVQYFIYLKPSWERLAYDSAGMLYDVYKSTFFEGDDHYYSSFSLTQTKPTVYYVEHSYADGGIDDGTNWGINVTLAPEPGPVRPITYQLEGGVNDPSNPATFIGGTTVTLKDPTRSGYLFAGWQEYYNNKWYKVGNGALTPTNQQLIDGVTVRATWTEMPEFKDVSASTPHADDITWLAASGISTGWKKSDGTVEFRPTSTVIRQDMAAFLFRLAKSWGLVGDDWQPSGSVTFTDVNTKTPHYREIMWLAESGVSAGWTVNGHREFRPRNTVVRQDMAAFLRRLQALRDPSVGDWRPTGASPFRDVTARTPHSEDILWLAESGVSAGWTMKDGGKEFRPMNTVIRQDMAAFLHRLDGLG